MARNLKGKKNPSATENWTKTKRMTERERALEALAKVKAYAAGRSYDLVKMEGTPRAHKFVDINKNKAS